MLSLDTQIYFMYRKVLLEICFYEIPRDFLGLKDSCVATIKQRLLLNQLLHNITLGTRKRDLTRAAVLLHCVKVWFGPVLQGVL